MLSDTEQKPNEKLQQLVENCILSDSTRFRDKGLSIYLFVCLSVYLHQCYYFHLGYWPHNFNVWPRDPQVWLA